MQVKQGKYKTNKRARELSKFRTLYLRVKFVLLVVLISDGPAQCMCVWFIICFGQALMLTLSV